MLGGPDLHAMTRQVAERTGVAPEMGGRHTEGGTLNSFLSLGPSIYLELIAPNPDDSRRGAWRDTMSARRVPAWLAFAVAVKLGGVRALAARAPAAGPGLMAPLTLRPGPVAPRSRP